MTRWLDNYGKLENANESKISTPPGYVGDGYINGPKFTNGAMKGTMENGGKLMPGMVGFSYARTQNIPSNGPYAKKTKASAQNGDVIYPDDNGYRMAYYQNGDDFKTKGMANGGWLDSYQEGGPVDPIREWTLDYINSPKYAERLKSSGYNVPEEIKQRRENVENVKIHNKKPTFIEAISEFRFPPSSGSHFTDGDINMDYEFDVPSIRKHYGAQMVMPTKDQIKAHEMGHAELFNPDNPKDNRLNEYDERNLIKRGLMSQDVNDHDKHADENKGDLNSLRYSLMKQGIYDAGKETFTKKHLKEAKKSFPKERLMRNYSDKSLIWLMNNIAQAEQSPQDGQFARHGGIIDDDLGQWAHPGEITRINSNDITMEGVDYPVLGVSDKGHQQMMYPDQRYKFRGKRVTEYPMGRNGINVNPLVEINQLRNFTNYNTKQPGGWLDQT